ncbi:MAG: DUF721 domain-containing protein [Spirochaetaceae bacterium]|jgi:hypothetical protein|nr:DUF721 domain-containing protein [Spirochaetaceae bacterium]
MDNVYSAGEAVASLFNALSSEGAKNADTTLSVWKKILLSIDEKKTKRDGTRSYTGESLYCHSKVVDCKNGILLIEVDHPGWVQLFQLARTYIVRGFKKFAPEFNVTSLSYRLKGQTASLRTKKPAPGPQTPPAGPQESPVSGQLPEELQQIFARMRENLLTHGRNL